MGNEDRKIKRKSKLKVATLNLQGMDEHGIENGKMEEITMMMEKLYVDVLGLQETNKN